MLQHAQILLKQMDKKSQQKLVVIKVNQMEITKLKKVIKKYLLDRLNSRTEMTEDRHNEPEDRSIEFTQSKHRNKID